jgi:hypothetical protein
MNFYARKSDIKDIIGPGVPRKEFSLDAGTSVMKQKRHFFDTLRSLGTITALDDDLSQAECRSIFLKPDAVFVGFSGYPIWDGVPMRMVCHTLGHFMLPEMLRFLSKFHENAVHLVATDFQMERLRRMLGECAPRLAVFTPELDERKFFPPTKKQRLTARKCHGITENEVHVVYAGRWLATKGLCQLMRMHRLWPVENAKLTFVGSFSPDFPLRYAGASHHTFENYFNREFISSQKGNTVRLLDARDAQGLREIFWSADLFVYASVHEDENFGMAPREATLCGVPAVVTDFCGLHSLASRMPWGGISTYPTFCGPRYSLRQMRDVISGALLTKIPPGEFIHSVISECDPVVAHDNLKKALALLCGEALKDPIPAGEKERGWRSELFAHADERLVRPFVQKEKIPPGAYVDGTGLWEGDPTYRGLLQAIHGFYTTLAGSPRVRPVDSLRGFFRIALWKEQKALVEFGFPGPRMRSYNEQEWNALTSCAKTHGASDDLVIRPETTDEIRLAQELVDLGFLVPDSF